MPTLRNQMIDDAAKIKMIELTLSCVLQLTCHRLTPAFFLNLFTFRQQDLASAYKVEITSIY
jgi:hypothetical protein